MSKRHFDRLLKLPESAQILRPGVAYLATCQNCLQQYEQAGKPVTSVPLTAEPKAGSYQPPQLTDLNVVSRLELHNTLILGVSCARCGFAQEICIQHTGPLTLVRMPDRLQMNREMAEEPKSEYEQALSVIAVPQQRRTAA